MAIPLHVPTCNARGCEPPCVLPDLGIDRMPSLIRVFYQVWSDTPVASVCTLLMVSEAANLFIYFFYVTLLLDGMSVQIVFTDF